MVLTEPSGGAGCILVVDDDTSILSLVVEALRMAGYKVFGASSPAEALTIHSLLQAPLSLLITDYHMPGMTGAELATRVRGKQPKLPVLSISGGQTAGEPTVNLADPFVHLPKPFSITALVQSVKKLIA